MGYVAYFEVMETHLNINYFNLGSLHLTCILLRIWSDFFFSPGLANTQNIQEKSRQKSNKKVN